MTDEGRSLRHFPWRDNDLEPFFAASNRFSNLNNPYITEIHNQRAEKIGNKGKKSAALKKEAAEGGETPPSRSLPAGFAVLPSPQGAAPLGRVAASPRNRARRWRGRVGPPGDERLVKSSCAYAALCPKGLPPLWTPRISSRGSGTACA